MCKRILLITLFFVICYNSVLGYDFQVDGIYYSINSDDPATVKVTYGKNYGNHYSGEVIIPAIVGYEGKDYKVNEIGAGAFYNCQNLISVRIPDGIKKIRNQAFYNCNKLESVNIPNSVETIEHQVFIFCESLKEIHLPRNTTSIGTYLCYRCSSLEKCEILSEIKIIPKNSFAFCESLKSVSLPESLNEIDSCAFDRCNSLENITLPANIVALKSSAFSCPLKTINLPASLKEIENGAFSVKEYIDLNPENSYFSLIDGILYTKDLRRLITSPASTIEAVIPNSVIKIDEGAFAENINLGKVVLSNSIDSLSNFIFSECTNLNEVEIPLSVKSIGNGAFYRCSNLLSINIPPSVVTIGEMAFAGCEKLKSIQIPESVRSIGSYVFAYTPIVSLQLPEGLNFMDAMAFGYCKKLQSIKFPDSVDSIPQKIFWECDELRDVQLSNTIKSIGEYAFYGCKSLQSLYIPSAVGNISSTAFLSCSSLDAIEISPSNTTYCSIDGIVFTKDMTKLFRCPPGRKEEVKIPESVTIIGEGAFRQCRFLDQLSLPESVVELEEFALFSLTINDITLPSSLTTIKNGSLYSNFKNIYCTSLRPPKWELPNEAFYPSYYIYTFPDEVFNNSILHIPGGTTFRYKDAKVWNQFQNIKEVDYSGTDIIEEETINIRSERGEIIIENKPSGALVMVYDILGRNVYSGTDNVIRGLGKDIYIVCIGKIKKKIRL